MGVPGPKKPSGTWASAGSGVMAAMKFAWSMACSTARRMAGLSNGGCRWLGRIISTSPVGSGRHDADRAVSLQQIQQVQ